MAAMVTDGGFFNDYYADQVSEPWWLATPEDEAARPATACSLAAPSAFSSSMSLDPLKQMPGPIDQRSEWPSSWQDFPAHLDSNDGVVPIQTHIQLDREDRWNALHSSDNESSPGSPVSAPTFFESEPVHMLEPDVGRVVPMMPVTTQASCRDAAASQTVPPVPSLESAKTHQQKKKRTQSVVPDRPAPKPARPLKKHRTKAPAPAPAKRPQVVQRSSARIPVPRVRQDFVHFTSDEEENEEEEKGEEKERAKWPQRSTRESTSTDGEEETVSSTDENDSSGTSLAAASAGEAASAAVVDVDTFPAEVKRCIKASQGRMLEWSEAATILRYHLKLKRHESHGPKLPTRPLCLGAEGAAQKGGVYIEMPKVPRPRHRCKSASARAKLTPEQKAKVAREILPGETLATTNSRQPLTGISQEIGLACTL